MIRRLFFDFIQAGRQDIIVASCQESPSAVDGGEGVQEREGGRERERQRERESESMRPLVRAVQLQCERAKEDSVWRVRLWCGLVFLL